MGDVEGLENWGLVEVGVSGWVGRNGGGVESGVCSVGKGWVSGGGVGCGGFQAGSVGLVMCSLLGGVTCVVGFSLDRCLFFFLVYGAQPLMVR